MRFLQTHGLGIRWRLASFIITTNDFPLQNAAQYFVLVHPRYYLYQQDSNYTNRAALYKQPSSSVPYSWYCMYMCLCLYNADLSAPPPVYTMYDYLLFIILVDVITCLTEETIIR
jgi:hypothetical protein